MKPFQKIPWGVRPISNLSFQRKVAACFTVTILVLASLFYIIKKNNQHFADTAYSVEHTQDVLLHADQLQAEIDDVQNGVAGFVITGDSQYLIPYNAAVSGFQESVLKLKTLTNDHLSLQRDNDSLRSLLTWITREAQQLVNIRKSYGFEKARDRIISNGYKNQIDQARWMLSSIQREEHIILDRVKANNIKSIGNSSVIITAFIFIMILLLLFAFLAIFNNTRRRNESEKKIKDINESLEQTVSEKAKEVIEKEQQYRFLIENMKEGIQVIGFDWRYIFLNNSIVHHGKYSKEELTGQLMTDKYPGIENTELFSILQGCMKERVAAMFENEFTYPDGSKGWFELSLQPVPEGLFILSTDISTRKKIEQELAAQQLREQKLITEITIRAQEKERNELGIELHDNINQLLATAGIYMGMAKKVENNRDELIGQSEQFLSQAIKEIRKLSHSLVTPSLGDITVHEVLNKLAIETSLINGLSVEFINQTDKNISLDKGKELMLYRIAQEQMTNIRKYSKAEKARIILNANSKNIYFSISDNGIGFIPSKKENGIGLKNIKSRVEFYSGKMNIISAPGNGCTLEVVVPV